MCKTLIFSEPNTFVREKDLQRVLPTCTRKKGKTNEHTNEDCSKIPLPLAQLLFILKTLKTQETWILTHPDVRVPPAVRLH